MCYTVLVSENIRHGILTQIQRDVTGLVSCLRAVFAAGFLCKTKLLLALDVVTSATHPTLTSNTKKNILLKVKIISWPFVKKFRFVLHINSALNAFLYTITSITETATEAYYTIHKCDELQIRQLKCKTEARPQAINQQL